MKTVLTFSGMIILCAVSSVAAAQQSSPAAPAKATLQSEAGEPRAMSESAPAASGGNAVKTTTLPAGNGGAARNAPKTADRLSLGTATVTGEREQPKVMYIVPWKSPNMGDLSGKPMNSLLDEALAPVDRDVFKREVAYYEAVRAKGEK